MRAAGKFVGGPGFRILEGFDSDHAAAKGKGKGEGRGERTAPGGSAITHLICIYALSLRT